ncbi:vinorine synthase [Quercus suber]|uniref:Vinorine synthase n=1 Tax=Quercus suber TaxID=58331 RepID=A0AAW0JSY8_QUESU
MAEGTRYVRITCRKKRRRPADSLTQFHMLARQVKDNLYIDCNNEGINYVEAEVKCNLSEFLKSPAPSKLNKFLPFELNEVNELPTTIQVTFFNCEIREKYSYDDKTIEYPHSSRVEALSTFIWSHFMAFTHPKPNPDKIYSILHAVNLRTKIEPSLPYEDIEGGFCGIIKPMKEAIKKIDWDFVKMLQ